MPDGCGGGDGTVGRLRRLIPLLALSILAACSPDGSEEVDDGRLLVTEAGGGVTLVEPAGETRTVLREPDGSPGPVQPAASPDGSRIVWSVAGDVPRIAFWEDGSVREEPAPLLPFFYQWRPDGGAVFALGNDPAGAGVAGLVAGDRDPAVLAVAAPFYVDWHPREESLAVHLDSTSLGSLALDGSLTTLGLPPGPFQAPAYTPAGDLVVVTGPPDGAGTAAVRPIAFAQDGGPQLTLIPAGDGSPRALSPVAGPAAFAVSPDGSRVALAESTGSSGVEGRLAVIDLEDGDRVEVARERPLVIDWSPDGRHLLYMTIDVEDGTLEPSVWDGDGSVAFPGFRPTPTFAGEYLPFWDQYQRALTLWSPAGDAFTYAATLEGGESRILVQALASDRPSDTGPGEWASWIPGERG